MSAIPDICRMIILLVAATTFEIQPTIHFLEERDRLDIPPATGLTPGGLPSRGHTTQVLITGIGSLPTAWSLMKEIGQQRPDLIIQAGIAGCLTDRPSGEVIVINEEVLADLGVWEEGNFKSLTDMKLVGPDQAPFSGGRLRNPYPELLALSGLESVTGMTVNEISTDSRRITWYKQNAGAVVESMEGGALHYVCLREGIAFLQFRSISNKVGIRDKTKWSIPLAIASLNEQLISFLEKLYTKDEKICQLP